MNPPSVVTSSSSVAASADDGFSDAGGVAAGLAAGLAGASVATADGDAAAGVLGVLLVHAATTTSDDSAATMSGRVTVRDAGTGWTSTTRGDAAWARRRGSAACGSRRGARTSSGQQRRLQGLGDEGCVALDGPAAADDEQLVQVRRAVRPQQVADLFHRRVRASEAALDETPGVDLHPLEPRAVRRLEHRRGVPVHRRRGAEQEQDRRDARRYLGGEATPCLEKLGSRAG